MRYEITQEIAKNPDYKIFLREHPDWYQELSYRPENFKMFVTYYKEERKLTLPDKIEKVSLLLNMLEMLK